MSTTSAPAESEPTSPIGPGHHQQVLSHATEPQRVKNEPKEEPEQHAGSQAQARSQSEILPPTPQPEIFPPTPQQQPVFHLPPAQQHHPNFHQPGPLHPTGAHHPGPQQPGIHPGHHPGLYQPGIHQHGMYQPALHQQGMYPAGLHPPGLHHHHHHHHTIPRLGSQQPGTPQGPYYHAAAQQPGPLFQQQHPDSHPHPQTHHHTLPRQSAPSAQHNSSQSQQPPQQSNPQQTQRPPKTPPHSPRHRYLTRDQRLQIMTLHAAGHTQLFIANQLGVTSRQVGYTIRSGSLTPKKRSGRPRKLSQAQCDQIEAFVAGNGPAPSGTAEGGWEEGRYMSYEKLAKGPFASWGVGEYAVRGVLRKRGYVRIGRELIKKAPDSSKPRKRARKPKVPSTTPTISIDDDDDEDSDPEDEENDDDGEGDEDDAIMQEHRGSPSAAAASDPQRAVNPLLNAHPTSTELNLGLGNAGMAPMVASAAETESKATENGHAAVPVAGQVS